MLPAGTSNTSIALETTSRRQEPHGFMVGTKIVASRSSGSTHIKWAWIFLFIDVDIRLIESVYENLSISEERSLHAWRIQTSPFVSHCGPAAVALTEPKTWREGAVMHRGREVLTRLERSSRSRGSHERTSAPAPVASPPMQKQRPTQTWSAWVSMSS